MNQHFRKVGIKFRALLLVFLFVSFLVRSQTPTDGLIRYFELNGNGNCEISNLVALPVGLPTGADDNAGNSSNASRFSGNDAYNFSHPDLYSLTNYTISAWVKINQIPDEGNRYVIVSIGTSRPGNPSGGDQVLAFSNNVDGRKGWSGWSYFNTNDHFLISDESELNNSVSWNHIALVRTNNRLSLFVNCKLAVTQNINGNVVPFYGNTPEANIARRQNNVNYSMADIDKVRIYNRAFDSLEINQLCLEFMTSNTNKIEENKVIYFYGNSDKY